MALMQSVPPRRDWRTVVFVSFESEFARLGGLAAVMRTLPRRMAGAGERVILVAPFFRQITACHTEWMRRLRPTGQTVAVRFEGETHTVTILESTEASGFTIYLLESRAFFTAPCKCDEYPHPPSAPCNPYVNPGRPRQLLRDALFFCAAVPKVLVALGYTRDLVLALQDWQTACAALTVKREPAIVSVAAMLTLHNPYDHPLRDEELTTVFWRSLEGPTVLTKMVPFSDGPLVTVSEHFAEELMQDPLHTHVYAPHLQLLFRERGVVGVDNGYFVERDFPDEAVAAARRGDLRPLLAEKRRRRQALVRKLSAYHPAGAWGALRDLEHFDGPIFHFFGRDDPRQKGYDVAAAAVRALPPGRAKFVFTPIPGDEGLEGLRFLRSLARERAGDVVVFPFRMEEGYPELQRGSSFMVMCSLYEPFGGATEGYAVGTPVVARATGGLVQQVAPYPGGAYSHAVRRRADRYHARGAPPTGILFREPDAPPEVQAEDWQQIIACEYGGADRVQARMRIPLFAAMVREARWALEDAIMLYRDEYAYARMIAAGFEMLPRFSWERAVRAYQRLYDGVCA